MRKLVRKKTVGLRKRMFPQELAIDLGSGNTRVYVKGQGIVLCEPSVVAIDAAAGGKVVAVGHEARKLVGKAPPHIKFIRPIKGGAIIDFEIAGAMLRRFISNLHNSRPGACPRITICVPADITQVGQFAVKESARLAGASNVRLVESLLAAAIGAGLPIHETTANMVVNIGCDTTEVGVISFSGIVYSRSARIGSGKMTEAIMRHVKRKYNMLIGENAAENIKVTIASAFRLDPELEMEVNGRDLVTGIPQSISITSEEARRAISEQLDSIVEIVRTALEEVPPELAADIVDRGIVLTGGGALLKGLDQLLRNETSLPLAVADDPLSTVVLGMGKALDNPHILREVFRG